jgi:hypothetical protein
MARTAEETAVRERELLDAQYAGERSMLKPIVSKLREVVSGFGGDARVEVREGEVAFIRRCVFALARPESATQVDLGLVLNDVAEHDRLIPAASFGEGMTHRVPLTNLDDTDGQALTWLRLAYEQDGGRECR